MVEPVSIEPLGEQRPRPVGPPAEVLVRPAATVMLVKDTPAGLEVFVLRRVVGMAFAGGMTAFPGGAVDGSDHETDHAAPLRWSGPDPQWWAAQLGVTPDTARALVVAAARELFEETGVLLAGPTARRVGAGRHRSDQIAAGSVTDADRIAVLDRRAPFADVLTGADLELRADLLRPWANWVTPAGHTRRYDTFFFTAAMPAGQQARLLTSEADLGQWRAPQALLAEYDVGAVQLMPPTLAMLTDLAGVGSVAEVMAARRVVTPVRFGEPSGGGTVGTVGTSVSVVRIAAAPDVTMRKGLS
jgi:8-oxo-dGTP pyrophosphatase MutT (NUDIX family)